MTKKLRFLIASGPTREPLDPVRYLSNYSTGTMGRYLTGEVKKRHHAVNWVECPADAETATDLQRELQKRLPKSDILIMAAAVCDVKPSYVSGNKIKKNQLSSIKLSKNPDILASLSRIKRKNQIFIGFGLESKRLVQNGLKKLKSKGLELIVLQKVTNYIKPFGDKPVDAILLSKREGLTRLSTISKQKLARLIIDRAEKLIGLKLEPREEGRVLRRA